MAQTLAMDIDLGGGYADLTLQLRVLNLDLSTFADWGRQADIVQLGTPGYYRVTSGVSFPNAGGYMDVRNAATQAVLPATYAADPISVTTGVSVVTVTPTGSVTNQTSDVTISVRRGDSWRIPFLGIGDLVGRSKLWFTVKPETGYTGYPDAQAVFHAEETGGLLYLNSTAYATPAHATITVTDETLGSGILDVDEAATTLVPFGTRYRYDIRVLLGGRTQSRQAGLFHVLGEVTRSIA